MTQLSLGFETAPIANASLDAVPAFWKILERFNAAVMASDQLAILKIDEEARDFAAALNGGTHFGLFLRKRLFFIQRDGSRAKSSGGAPSVLVAYGEANMQALRASGLKGGLVDLQIPHALTRYARPRRRRPELTVYA